MSDEPPQISEREREILRLVARGATNQQIANQLNISVNTVKVHLRNIFGKIGVASRTEATLYAVRTGLVQVGETPALQGAPPVAVAEAAPEAGLEPSAPPDTPLMPAQVRGGADDRADQSVGPAGAAAGVQPLPASTVSPVVPALGRRWLLGIGLLVGALLAIGALWAATRLGPSVQPTASAPTAAGVVLPGPDERWHTLAEMPAPRFGFALAYYDRKLYAIGGESSDTVSDQVLRYDLAANSWAALSPKPTAVSDVQAAVVGNKIYVPGGRLENGAISDQLDIYDPQADRWTRGARLPAPRSGYALAAVEGKLYLFGGWDGSAYRNDVWQYDPDADRWSERTPMRDARAFASAAVVEGQVYVMGGENADGALTLNERYVPAVDNGSGTPWAIRAPLPAPRSRLAVAAVGESGLIFVLGGAAAEGASMLYNSALDSWQALQLPLEATLRDLRAQGIGEKLYILGGRDEESVSAQLYEYQALYTVVLPIR